jgi:hypothetical protein
LTKVLYTPGVIAPGLPINVTVVGVLGVDKENVSHGTVVVGVTGITAEGALVTVIGCDTGPPPSIAFRKTTFGVVVSVF